MEANSGMESQGQNSVGQTAAPNKRTKPSSASQNKKLYANWECLALNICRGKHLKVESDIATKQLFKDQQIKIVETEDECRAVVSELRRHLDEYNVLGFDCEWLSLYRRYPVALLQLATHRGLCALIRLCKLKKIPEELKQLLEDKNVLKVGVESFSDAKYLVKDYGIGCVASTLDLRSLAKDCGCKSSGLAGLADELFQVQLNKSPCVPASNWNIDKLRNIQVSYAANDAHISIKIFEAFEEKLKTKPNDCNQKEHVQEFIDEFCTKYLNLNPEKEPKEKIDRFENQEIWYINSLNECQTAVNLLKSHCNEYNVLGYKWLPTIDGSKPVNLLQLASHRRLSVIIPFGGQFPNIPAELRDLLEDRRILKVGVEPAIILPTTWHVSSTLDLNYLLCNFEKQPLKLTLQALSKRFIKIKLNQTPSRKLHVVKSSLEVNDAHIAMEIFKEFVMRLQTKTADGNEEMNLEQKINNNVLEQFIEKHCLKYLDVIFDGGSELAKNACAEANKKKPLVNKKKTPQANDIDPPPKQNKVEPKQEDETAFWMDNGYSNMMYKF